MPTSNHRFTVRFWGVRGSIPTPGPTTQAIGGNTSCLEVRCDDHVIILDAGSGLRPLGEALARENLKSATFLFSHVHWDHILGFPYFVPIIEKTAQFQIFGETKGGQTVADILDEQARLARAPLMKARGGATLQYEVIVPKDEFKIGPATIKVGRMNHPDGCVAFRIEHAGHAIVYATDTEHESGRLDRRLIDVSHDADMLVYDAMYTDAEYAGEIGGSKKGWGHSTWRAGIEVAEAASVDRLFLFHHDPGHDDRFVENIEKEASKEFKGAIASREGMVFNAITGRVTRPKRKLTASKTPARGIAKRR